jgi:hypothetical protein
MDPLVAGQLVATWGGTAGTIDEEYGCDLEHLASHLIPIRLLETLDRSPPAEPLFLSDRSWLDPRVPPELVADAPPPIHRDPWTLWVEAPGTGVVFPYLLGERAASWVANRGPGARDDQSLGDRDRQLLRAVGALVPSDWAAKELGAWRDAYDVASRRFSKGYVAVGGLMHPFHLAALRARYRRLIRTNAFHLGDSQTSGRYVAHNEPVARFFHRQFGSVVSRIVGRRVKSSYTYFAGYEPGSDLPVHVDRPQCEYTLAMCIDCTPEPQSHTPWPLHLELADESVAVYQALGDALLYRGREIPHYRDPLPPGRTVVSVFFHYVNEEFQGPLA